MPSCIVYCVRVVIVLALSGCTKPNPEYCTDSSTCPNGTACNVQSHACETPSDAAIPDAPCSVSPQGGCSASAACRVDSCVQGNERTECSAIGTGTSRSSCTGHADCAANFACSGDLCRHYCASTADCEAPGGECIDLTCGSPENGTNVCTENCDPIPFASECPGGYACRIKPTRPAFTSCGPTGTANGGDSCTTDADCRQGYACLGSGTFHWAHFIA
jgi:hypothetical protein